MIVVDVDGTITIVGDRLKYLEQSPKGWDKFYESCFDDDPQKDIVTLVQLLIDSGRQILFCTGRRESCRTDTIKWLVKHFEFGQFTPVHLAMRPNDSKEHDTIIKPRIMSEFLASRHLPNSEVEFILEDRNSMVKKWRELGYRCLQVQEGDF